MNRVSPAEAVSPQATPTIASVTPCRTNIRFNCACCAPSATRTPMSRVLCTTVRNHCAVDAHRSKQHGRGGGDAKHHERERRPRQRVVIEPGEFERAPTERSDRRGSGTSSRQPPVSEGSHHHRCGECRGLTFHGDTRSTTLRARLGGEPAGIARGRTAVKRLWKLPDLWTRKACAHRSLEN